MSRRFDDRRDDDEAPRGPGPNEAYRVGPGARGRDLHDPYAARRETPSYRDDRGHPWEAAHPDDPRTAGAPSPTWEEQPARYGGGYRGDARGTEASRRLEQAGYGADARHRGYPPRGYRDDRGQNNSGYEASRSYDEGGAARREEEHLRGPADRARSPARGMHGAQAGHEDTYGSAGWRQEGKRYWFAEDEPGRYRGVAPRGYRRSDERLREVVCEALTEADLDASDIAVEVHDGVVSLEGSVRARWMKHRAEDIVDDCGGVKDIRNALRVGSASREPAPQPGDEDNPTRPH